MTTNSPAAPRRARRFTASRFAVRVGADWSLIRAATIWPIADALAAEAGFAAPHAGSESASEASAERLVLDLVDSGMIAPPRTRRRRERPVSSRAVFYQAES